MQQCKADPRTAALSDAQIKERLGALGEAEREQLVALSAASKTAAALARSLCPRGEAATERAASHKPAKRQKRAAAAAEAAKLLDARLAHIDDAWQESAADFAATVEGAILFSELTADCISAVCAHLEQLCRLP